MNCLYYNKKCQKFGKVVNAWKNMQAFVEDSRFQTEADRAVHSGENTIEIEL